MDKNKLVAIQAVVFGIVFTALANVDFFEERIWLQFLVFTAVAYISDKIINAFSKK